MNAKNSNKVLITGGCGFIGSNLVRYLLQEGGYRIKILDNLSVGNTKYIEEIASQNKDVKLTIPNQHPAKKIQDPKPRTQDPNPTQQLNDSTVKTVDVLQGDIRNQEIVDKATNGVDAIVHLAAITGVPDSIKDPVKTYEVNVTGTQNLLEAANKNHIQRFVFASSNAAVGEKQPPIHEQMTPHPISPYGASKLAGEALCSAYYHSFGINAISLRFANVYGPYSEHKTSVIPKFIRRAKQGKPLVIYGDGQQTRDFIHVHDIARAIDLALNYDPINATKRNKRSNETNSAKRNNPQSSQERTPKSRDLTPNTQDLKFQIGTGVETKIINLAAMVKDLAIQSGLNPPEIVFEEPRKGEIRKNYADINKAKELLGFQPEIEVKQGIKMSWDGLS